jgi:hypothetical protein
MEKLNLRNGFWEKENLRARFGSRSDAKTLAGRLALVYKLCRVPIKGGSVKQMRLLSAIFVIAVVFGSCGSARAQGEITLLAVGPMRAPTQKIVANFEAKTGYKVKVTYGNGADTRRMVAKGQTLDVNLVVYPFPGAIASGTIDPNSATTVTSILTAVGVPRGRPILTFPRPPQ